MTTENQRWYVVVRYWVGCERPDWIRTTVRAQTQAEAITKAAGPPEGSIRRRADWIKATEVPG